MRGCLEKGSVVATYDFVGGLCVLAWHAGCPCYAVVNTA